MTAEQIAAQLADDHARMSARRRRADIIRTSLSIGAFLTVGILGALAAYGLIMGMFIVATAWGY